MTTLITPAEVKQGPRKARDFSKWHERTIEGLLTHSGLNVRSEPNMDGKTPDLLATPQEGQQFVVECIARLPDPRHAAEMEQNGFHVCDGDIGSLRANIYSRLDQKATKYRQIASAMPYVIALYDGSCLNSLQTAIDMTMSPYQPTLERYEDGTVRNRRYDRIWQAQEIPGALFELYPHLSGLIYSRWPKEHWYLPNPRATRPVDPAHLPFAAVPALPYQYRTQGWQPREATLADTSPEPPQEWLSQLRNTSNSALHHFCAH